MTGCLQSWPEPVVRVQSLAESGIISIPKCYIKPLSQRPSASFSNNNNNTINNSDSSIISKSSSSSSSTTTTTSEEEIEEDIDIPIINLEDLFSDEERVRERALSLLSEACREWGFFQIVNHGVSHELMKNVKAMWREFFALPLEVKQEYSNSPVTYEGYGSRLGVEKGAVLDWSDYFFLHFMPPTLRNPDKWPSLPPSCRDLIMEYGNEVVRLCGKLMKFLSINLGLGEDYLQNAYGGDDIGACLRVNFYPKCPQPDLTLGLSSHSDPGGLTLLLPEENVAGLQVRRGDSWITVKPIPNSFIVNIGDQTQVLSNAIYKSVEHRVIVNSQKDRVSLAFFYNPKGDLLIQPAKELVTKDRPAIYPAMTFDEYRLYIRTKGPCGKAQVESLKSSR